MADQKITALTSLAQADIVSGTDVLPIVDVGSPSVTKKATPKAVVGASVNDLAQTWNAGGTTFTAIKMNATDTASAAASLLLDLQKDGVTQVSVSKSSVISRTPSLTYSTVIDNSGFLATVPSGQANSVRLLQTGTTTVTFANLASSGRAAIFGDANFLQLGSANAASPVAQTLGTQGSRSGTDTNVGGANLTIQAGGGTGTGTISTLILQAPVAVASGTGAQTQTTGLTIKAGTAVMTSYTVATLPTAATAGAGARAFVTDALTPTFGSAVTGGGAVNVPVYSTGTAWNVG